MTGRVGKLVKEFSDKGNSYYCPSIFQQFNMLRGSSRAEPSRGQRTNGARRSDIRTTSEIRARTDRSTLQSTYTLRHDTEPKGCTVKPLKLYANWWLGPILIPRCRAPNPDTIERERTGGSDAEARKKNKVGNKGTVGNGVRRSSSLPTTSAKAAPTRLWSDPSHIAFPNNPVTFLETLEMLKASQSRAETADAFQCRRTSRKTTSKERGTKTPRAGRPDERGECGRRAWAAPDVKLGGCRLITKGIFIAIRPSTVTGRLERSRRTHYSAAVWSALVAMNAALSLPQNCRLVFTAAWRSRSKRPRQAKLPHSAAGVVNYHRFGSSYRGLVLGSFRSSTRRAEPSRAEASRRALCRPIPARLTAPSRNTNMGTSSILTERRT